jgi:alpha-1,2-mannosyltransferase
MAAVLADLCADRPRWPRGTLIGLAAAVKLTPAVFILYLVVTRRRRPAATALGTALVASAGAFLIASAASVEYWRRLVFAERRIGSIAFVWNQSLRGSVARLASGSDGHRLVWIFAAAVVLPAGLWVAARAKRHGDELLGVGIAALTGLLVSPISWNHHWVWALPVAVGLVRGRLVGGRVVAWLLALMWTTTFTVARLLWPFVPGSRPPTRAPVLNELYVVAALALVGFLGWRLWPRRLTEPVPTSSPRLGVRSSRGRSRPVRATE